MQALVRRAFTLACVAGLALAWAPFAGAEPAAVAVDAAAPEATAQVATGPATDPATASPASDAAVPPSAPDAPAGAAAAPPAPSIADLPVDETTYENTTNCINLREIRNHIVLDDRNLVFELRRGRYVLSQLRQRCEFLRQRDTIALNTTGGGSQLCALDQVSVLEPNLGVGRAVGAIDSVGGFAVIGRCFLGPFEEITKEQLAAMRDAMKARQRDSGSFWDWIKGE
jgi:hypothetical protein